MSTFDYILYPSSSIYAYFNTYVLRLLVVVTNPPRTCIISLVLNTCMILRVLYSSYNARTLLGCVLVPVRIPSVV